MPCIKYVELLGFEPGYVLFQDKHDPSELRHLIRDLPEALRDKITEGYHRHAHVNGYCSVPHGPYAWFIFVFEPTAHDTLITLGHEAFHVADRLPYFKDGVLRTKDRADELRAEAVGTIMATAYPAYLRSKEVRPLPAVIRPEPTMRVANPLPSATSYDFEGVLTPIRDAIATAIADAFSASGLKVRAVKSTDP